MTDLRCFPRHARAAGVCMRGCREWAAQHGFDWMTFVRDGVPADDLLSTGDIFALKTVQAAQRERDAEHVEQG